MVKLLKKIQTILKKGSTTSSEANKIIKEYEELKTDEKDVLKHDVEKIKKMVKEIGREEEEEKKGDKESNDETEKEVEKMIGHLIKKEITSLKDEVKEYIVEEKELAKKKAGYYHPDVMEKRKEINELTRITCKACLGFSDEEIKLKEMTTDATGSPYAGYVVDSELSAEIRHLKTEYGLAAREMTPIKLSKNSYKANELVTDVVSYWVDEAGSVSSSQVVLGQNTLELKKIAVIVAFTNELLEDEEIDLASFVTTRVAESFAEKEDEAFFNGDGSSTYGGWTGILKSTNVNTKVMTETTFSSFTPDYLLDLIDETPSGALSNAKFYMHRSIYNLVRQKKTTDGEYIFQKPSETGPIACWGYPVILGEVLPTTGDSAADTAFVIFGDLKKGCLYGYKGGMVATRADQASIRNVANNADINLFTTDRQGIRWVQRVGMVQQIQNLKIPITLLKTAAASA